MLANFTKPDTSKELYFRLSNAFRLSDIYCSSTCKYSGVYAIYKESVCYYVGQSSNMPSRLSTHLTGKYSAADEIRLYMPSEFDYFSDFYSERKESQIQILEENENHCINRFSPVENILVNREKDTYYKFLFANLTGDTTNPETDLTIHQNEYGLLCVVDSTIEAWHLPSPIIDPFIHEMESVNDYLRSKIETNNE